MSDGLIGNILGLFVRGKAGGSTRLTTINIRYMGSVHGMDGFQVSGRVFEVNIPFNNKVNDILPDNLRGPKLNVNSIKVGEPFKLISITPALPVEIDYMSKAVFKLKIQAPDTPYEGPMSVDFGNDPKDIIHISIQKIMLEYNGSRTELPDSSMIMNLQKNIVFKKEVQLYRIVSYGSRVDSMEISKPFEIVSTDPKLPIVADRKDSYVMGVYIKAPDISYAGELTIKFK